MECTGPGWIINLFRWVTEELITQETLNDAMNYILNKGIITCYELV